MEQHILYVYRQNIIIGIGMEKVEIDEKEKVKVLSWGVETGGK